MNLKDRRKNKLCIAILAMLVSFPAFASTVKDVTAEQGINIKAAKDSQKTVNAISDESQALRNEYRQILQAIENNKTYNQQLRALIESQKLEMTQIEEDIEKIKDTTRNITPLMTKMKDSLAEFVKLDLPFLQEERQKRLQNLDELFVKSGVSVSEKYRKVLEAYLVESEYGQTLEAYKDSMDLDGTKVTVDFLKVGRVGLYYLTKDGKKGGVWNPESQLWISLDSSQRNHVKGALKVALKQTSPSLLTLPVYKTSTKEVAVESMSLTPSSQTEVQ